MNNGKIRNMGLSARHYDIIIYGASFNGIVAAAAAADKGKSVLLLNQFGFAGGSITESLNCLQKYDPEHITPNVKKICDLLSDEMVEFTVNGLKEYFLNPESVKLALQNFIEQLNIDVLFHIKAYGVERSQTESISLRLAAKEGSLTLSCRQLIDATEDSTIGMISGMCESLQITGIFNVIVSGSGIHDAVKELKPQRHLKIDDKRCWASFKIADSSELTADSTMQTAADSICGVLRKYSSRIQLLPAVYHRINELKMNTTLSNQKDIIILNSLFIQKNNPDEVILKAALLEKEITKIINPEKE